MRLKLILPLIAFCTPAVARGSGMMPCESKALDIGAVYKESDLVAIGPIVANHAVNKKKGLWTMELKVTWPIKGIAKRPEIEFFKPDCDDTACGGNGISPSPHFVQPTEYLFFLKRNPEGTYRRIGIECHQLTSGFLKDGYVEIRTLRLMPSDLKKYLDQNPKPLLPHSP